ncbi:MAG: Eco57I restriction-modification methylase domain-containing protein [Candidatus Hodarchaeota archaeon]
MLQRQKKDLGAYYTPSHLSRKLTEIAINQYLTRKINLIYNSKFLSIEEIISSTVDSSIIEHLNDILTDIKVLDGAAGEGEFLFAALITIYSFRKRIKQKYEKSFLSSLDLKLEILRNNLFGMEINPEALSKCKRKLISEIPQSYIPSLEKHLDKNLITGNFLNVLHSKWPFSSSNKGFDIILGNPPWGGRLIKEEKDFYQEKFELKSPKRNLNTFELFVYQASRLLIPSQGILAYLLPKNITRSNQYTHLRKFILNNFQILLLNFHGLFQNVTQEFIFLIALRSHNIPSKHEIFVDDTIYIPQFMYHSNIDYIFTRTYDLQSQKLVQLILKDSKPLREFLTIQRGEELSKKGGLMYCPHCTKWVPLSSRRRDITCSRCLKTLERKDLKIKFIIQTDPDLNHTQPILTGDDFNTFLISGTHFIDSSIEYHSKKDPEIYLSPKLVVQKIKRIPCTAYESDNYWTTQNVYNLRLLPEYANQPELLYYVLAILNSSLIHWYYESQFNLGSKYTNAISIRNLKRLPIKKPKYDKPIFHQIVQSARKITEKETANALSLHHNNLDQLVLKYYNCENFLLPSLHPL